MPYSSAPDTVMAALQTLILPMLRGVGLAPDFLSMPGTIPDGPSWRREGQRGQAVVEFGLVILLFVLLIGGMFEFGLLLNLRASVSSLSRDLARSASLGATQTALFAEANLPTKSLLGVTTDTFGAYCCDVGDAVVVTTSYYDANCASNCTDKTLALAQPGDRVEVVVTVMGADVVTPMVRPFFGCTDGSAPHCFAHITASTSMRFEGIAPT